MGCKDAIIAKTTLGLLQRSGVSYVEKSPVKDVWATREGAAKCYGPELRVSRFLLCFLCRKAESFLCREAFSRQWFTTALVGA